MNTSQQEVYNRLAPRLKDIANRLAQSDQSGYLEPDDIFQQMTVVFLERSERDPDFIHQTDAYICVTCAHNGGTNIVRKQRVYRRYVYTLNDASPEDAETEPVQFPSPDPGPEQHVERYQFLVDLAAAVRKLAPTDQTIVKMLYLGDRPTDIAAALGVNRSTIHKRQRIIARQILAGT